MVIRQLTSDIRTLNLMDGLEFVSIAGFICSVMVITIIWSGNLPT